MKSTDGNFFPQYFLSSFCCCFLIIFFAFFSPPLPGINIKDMSRKTDFNTLDNVSCTFDKYVFFFFSFWYLSHLFFFSFSIFSVVLAESALLSGISYVENGEYKLRDPKVPFKFVSVAQRLMSGNIIFSLLFSFVLCVNFYE